MKLHKRIERVAFFHSNIFINRLHRIFKNLQNRAISCRKQSFIRNWVLKRGFAKRQGMPQDTMRIPLLLAICLLSMVGMLLIRNNAHAEDLQEGIAREIIRFHVIANSDSTEDQALKLRVKDALVKELSPLLKDTDNIEEGRAILLSHLPEITAAATKVVRQNGYSYPVLVNLEPSYFPLKIYGDYTFPPGTYEALKVKIGEASGQNWWCVMFPPLCFVDETYSIVNTGTEDQLAQLLTEEELDSLKDQKVPVKYKFKLWESVKKLFR